MTAWISFKLGRYLTVCDERYDGGSKLGAF
jgi:hypothetical protein